jgi:hypothetical protein
MSDAPMRTLVDKAARYGITPIAVNQFTGIPIGLMVCLMEDYPPAVLEFFLAGCAFNMTGGNTPCHADVQQDVRLSPLQHEKLNESQQKPPGAPQSSLESLTQALTTQSQSITELANSIAMLAQGIMEMADDQQEEVDSEFYLDGTRKVKQQPN